MGFLLDIKTIFITLVIGHLFFAVLISAVWHRNKKDSTINTYFFAKCLQAIAWCYLALRGGIPDVLTISLFNTLIFIGDAMELIAVLKLQDMFYARTKKIYTVLTATNIIVFHLIIFLYNEESIRITFASIGTAALIIIPAYKMIRKKPSSLLTKMMGYLYLLITIIFFIRALSVLLFNQSIGLFTPGILQTVSLLALYVIMILGNTGFLLLLKEQADKDLLRLASYDDLTNTLNRRTFILHAKQCLTVCARKKKPVSLLLFDVDHFKKINDTHGHAVGDQVLRNLTERINDKLGTENLFGRYGGDEFAILLPGMDETKSTAYAERIRQMVDREFNQHLPVPYTLSLGVLTVIPTQHTQLEILYISCDRALYGAKKNGRNCVFRTQTPQ